MVVVIADPTLEPRRRSCGLNAPNQAFADQDAERVVHRLQRNGADFGSHSVRDRVGGDVRLTRYGAQNGQSLRRHLNTTLAKERGWVNLHAE